MIVPPCAVSNVLVLVILDSRLRVQCKTPPCTMSAGEDLVWNATAAAPHRFLYGDEPAATNRPVRLRLRRIPQADGWARKLWEIGIGRFKAMVRLRACTGHCGGFGPGRGPARATGVIRNDISGARR